MLFSTLAFPHTLTQVRMPNGARVQLRIGIHTGPAVSGLVGLGVPKVGLQMRGELGLKRRKGGGGTKRGVAVSGRVGLGFSLVRWAREEKGRVEQGWWMGTQKGVVLPGSLFWLHMVIFFALSITLQWSVFGDTVNLAARMEQTCPLGCIQISQTTRDLLPPIDMGFAPTGGVEAKVRGGGLGHLGLRVLQSRTWCAAI